MAGIIAYCGLDCSACEAYQATLADDVAWKERIAAQWREQYNNADFNIMSVTCDGCTVNGGRLGAYCPNCPVRACASVKGVAHCAACAEYPCATIEGFFAVAPEVRANLEALRG